MRKFEICFNIQLKNQIIFWISIISLVPIIFYRNIGIERICLLITFFLMLALAIKEHHLQNSKIFIIFTLNFMSILLTIINHGGEGIGLTFLNVLLCGCVFNNIDINFTEIQKIYLSIGLVLLIFLLSCDLKYAYAGIVFTAFGMQVNTNMFGLYALACFFHWICFFSLIKKKHWYVVGANFLISTICFYYIWRSECRSAMMSVVIFIMLLSLKKQAFKYRMFRGITIVAFGASICFSIFYSTYFFEHYQNIEIFGKSLFSGRQIVWKSAWDAYINSPILGNGSSVILKSVHGSVTASAHNTMLSIMYTLGTIPTISFIYMLTRRFRVNEFKHYNRIPQFIFISSLFVSFFESFFTEAKLYLLFMVFLLQVNMCKSNGEIL